MFEYVKNAGLKFNGALIKRTSTVGLVLHQIEGNMTVQATHAYHLSKGHKGIDYNVYVDADGTIYYGRGLEYEGGHVKGDMNKKTIGVVFNGNFNKTKMPAAQLEAGKKLIRDILKKYSTIKWIYGHKELRTQVDSSQTNTDCPGKNFPLKELKALYGEKTQSATPTPVTPSPTTSVMPTLRIGSKGDAVKVLQKELNKVLGKKLDVDGAFGPKTAAAVCEFQIKKELVVVNSETWAALRF